MAVSIKSAREIELMRESCRLLEIVHDELGKAIRPGISTLEIDQMGEKMIRDMGCIPNFKIIMDIRLPSVSLSTTR